jgi:hypothetical protein
MEERRWVILTPFLFTPEEDRSEKKNVGKKS